MKLKRLLIALGIILLFSSAVVVSFAIESETTPTVSIEAMNLSFDNNVYLYAAIYFDNINTQTASSGVIFWKTPQENDTYTYENALHNEEAEIHTTALGTEKVNNKDCVIYDHQLAAKQIADIFYVQAYAKIDTTYYYSDVIEYGAGIYAERKLGLVDDVEGTQDENLKSLLRAMLNYGAAAQQYFNYNTKFLATDYMLPKYTVTFYDKDGKTALKTEQVREGKSAMPPEAPTHENYIFETWLEDYSNIRRDLTVTAYYVPTLEYTVYDNYCSVSGIGTCTLTEIEIPAVYQGKPVTTIDYGAFRGCLQLHRLILPFATQEFQTISIEPYAFYCCVNLEEVVFSEYELDSDSNAFYEVVYIGTNAFAECTSLSTFSFPEDLLAIYSYEDAFWHCRNISSVYVSVETLCNSHFSNPFSNPLAYGAALYENDELVYFLQFPFDIDTIPAYAFFRCSSIVAVQLSGSSPYGSGITNIGEEAFGGCTNLLVVLNVSNNITVTAGSTDYGCVAANAKQVLTESDLMTEAPNLVEENGFYFYATEDSAILLGYMGNKTELTLPDNFNERPYVIADCAFRGNKNITQITIPDNAVTAIGRYAFAASGITSLTIPNSVETIGTGLVACCKNLESISIGDGVTTLPGYLFEECSKLSSVYIGSGVFDINFDSFETCFYGCATLFKSNWQNVITYNGSYSAFASRMEGSWPKLKRSYDERFRY